MKSKQRLFQLYERTQQFVRVDDVAATFAMRVNDPSPSIACYRDQSGGTEPVSDYAIAPAKFEHANFGRLLFPLLRDNSTLGRSPLSESLAEKSFRHDNLPFFWGYSSVGRASRSQ